MFSSMSEETPLEPQMETIIMRICILERCFQPNSVRMSLQPCSVSSDGMTLGGGVSKCSFDSSLSPFCPILWRCMGLCRYLWTLTFHMVAVSQPPNIYSDFAKQYLEAFPGFSLRKWLTNCLGAFLVFSLCFWPKNLDLCTILYIVLLIFSTPPAMQPHGFEDKNIHAFHLNNCNGNFLWKEDTPKSPWKNKVIALQNDFLLLHCFPFASAVCLLWAVQLWFFGVSSSKSTAELLCAKRIATFIFPLS